MKKAIIQDGYILGLGDHYDSAIADARNWGSEIDENDIADNPGLIQSQNDAAWIEVDEYVADEVAAGETQPELVKHEDGHYTTPRGISEGEGRKVESEQERKAMIERQKNYYGIDD